MEKKLTYNCHQLLALSIWSSIFHQRSSKTDCYAPLSSNFSPVIKQLSMLNSWVVKEHKANMYCLCWILTTLCAKKKKPSICETWCVTNTLYCHSELPKCGKTCSSTKACIKMLIYHYLVFFRVVCWWLFFKFWKFAFSFTPASSQFQSAVLCIKSHQFIFKQQRGILFWAVWSGFWQAQCWLWGTY